MIRYETGSDIDPDAFIGLYHASTLGERRPVSDRDRMVAMLRNANLLVSAWDGDRLVGLARSLTDFVYATYVSDLAVHRDYQRRGIGVELLRRTRERTAPSTLILLSAPAATGYYPKVGFRPHPSAWVLSPEDRLGADGRGE